MKKVLKIKIKRNRGNFRNVEDIDFIDIYGMDAYWKNLEGYDYLKQFPKTIKNSSPSYYIYLVT